jgi:hypothetical protein
MVTVGKLGQSDTRCYGGKLGFMLSPKLERIELRERERFDSEYFFPYFSTIAMLI